MNWDDYFLGLAMMTANKSKDPSTHVGACLVDKDNIVAAVGFNGLPRGVPDDAWLLEDRNVKLKVVLHAEENALLFARRDVSGGTAYVWPMPPCAKCAAKLIQAGIKRVVAPEPSGALYDRWGNDWALAEWMYDKAGVTLDLVEET